MPVAETIGIVGSIIAIIQISQAIISACQFYIDAVDGAASDLQAIHIEISMLEGIAKSLQYLTQPNVANSALLNQLAAVTGPIEGCKKTLKELEALFPSAAVSVKGQKSKRRKLDAAAAALAWPLKKGRAKVLLQVVIQHKTTINLALTTEFVHDLKDVKQKAEQIQNHLTDSDREKVYRWLERTNPSDIHNRSQSLYEPGTASWVLRTPQWPLWIEGKHRCLWIHGIPGAGKSILASYVAEEIEKYCTSSSSESSRLGRAYYYCYFGHNQDEASHFLRWIIGQLCRQSAALPENLQNVYKSGKTPTLSCLLSILHSTMEGFERIYLVLDAVDESMPREDLLRVVQDLSTDTRFSTLSLLVTSRRYIDIEEALESCSIPITMSNSFVEEDIGTLVRSAVRSDARYQRWPEDLICEMQDTIPKRANGMFRWAVCQLDILKRLPPDASIIRAALSNLPKTLDETYERIFLAIPEDDWLSVQHVFHWMVYHNDLFGDNIPLSNLLRAVQQSTADLLSHDAVQPHDFEGLCERCGCLIAVVQGRLGDYQRSTVSFAHYTVKEYLQSPRISQKKVGFFALSKDIIQKQLAGIALRQALAIQPGSLAEYEPWKGDVDIRDLLDADFMLYCAVSSAVQLNIWPEALSSDPNLMTLSEALVNPYRPASLDLCTLLSMADNGYVTAKSTLYRDFQFWDIQWKKISDPDPAIFLGLLLASGFSGKTQLALAFATKHSMRTVLTQQLHITKEIWGRFGVDAWEVVDFIGSVPEIIAQSAIRRQDTFKFILDLISEHGVANFDLSTLLLTYIGNHVHDTCNESCSLGRLLCLGASANGPEGAFVTPLQVAVACWDLHGMEMLLNAGAEPNALGINGTAWDPGSFMEPFNYLHGVSSLHIIKCFECSYDKDYNNSFGRDETARRSIETRLSESGAVDIGPNLEPGPHDISDESTK